MKKAANRPRRPILIKLLVSLLIPLMVVYALILLFSFRYSKSNAERNSAQYLSQLCAHHASLLDGSLKEVMRQTESLAALILLQPRPPRADLQAYLKKNVRSNPFLSGLAFAFEPFGYESNLRLYAPYLCRRDSLIEPLDVAKSYDYTLEDWYSSPRASRKGYWTEPYLGGASGILNGTYTYPALDANGLKGIAAADLSLTDLTKELADLKLLDGYVFLVSRKGNFISHPAQDWILKKNLYSLTKSDSLEYGVLVEKLPASQQGIAKTKGRHKLWVVYQQIPSTGWTFAAVVSEKAVMQQVYKQLITHLILMSLGLLIIMTLIVFSAVSITKPIRALSLRAHQIASGDLDTLIPVPDTNDELSILADDVNHMSAELKAQIVHVKSMAAANARVESELFIARNIQQSLLPHVFPPFPKRREFSLYAQMIPAREVAGDFFDFFFVDPDHLVLIIADVSGKGIPAALFMAVTRTLLKTACDSVTSPAEALNKVNSILSADNDNCMFTTLFMGVYNVISGAFIYANAGHLPPLLFCPKGDYRMLACFGDPALGIVEDHQYHQSEVTLAIDERLVFYTDGVTEAQDESSQMFGLERFIALLQGSLHEPIEAVQSHIKDELFAYQRGDLADDITMLFFCRKL